MTTALLRSFLKCTDTIVHLEEEITKLTQLGNFATVVLSTQSVELINRIKVDRLMKLHNSCQEMSRWHVKNGAWLVPDSLTSEQLQKVFKAIALCNQWMYQG